MFVRFRERNYRLQVSLIETRRVDGKVRHEHIASFGSIDIPLTVPARITFWQRLYERLGKLSNRVDPATQGKVLGEVHTRIPMVTADEQRALQLENAEADARFWEMVHSHDKGTIEEHKALVASAEHAITGIQSGMADTAAKATVAKDRVERIKKGEDVSGGLRAPFTREDMERELIKLGFTKAELQHCVRLAQVAEFFGEDSDEIKRLRRVRLDAMSSAEHAAVRALHRRMRREQADRDETIIADRG
jgi:hypothetical protein